METVDDDILALCVPADANDDGDLDAWVAALHSTATDEATLPDQSARPAKLRRTSKRDELLHLRAKHDALTAQLQALVADSAAVAVPKSDWADRAKDQAIAAQQALHENARLQELLHDQLKTIATIQRAFARQPNLCDFACVAPWKMASLGVTGRREAKAKLMQHQYAKLETEWICHGLHEFEATHADVDTRKHYVRCEDDGLWVHFVECQMWHVDATTLANAVWSMFTHQLQSQPDNFSAAEVEIEDNLAYFHYTAHIAKSALPPIDGRVLVGRFREADRVVFVTRSILDDALFPSNPARFLQNQCSWIVVEATGNQTTRLTSYARFSPPLVPTESTVTEFTPGMYTDCLLELTSQKELSLRHTIQVALLASTTPTTLL